MSTIKVTRRHFIKAAAMVTGTAVLGFNYTKEAIAAGMGFVGLRQKQVYATDANSSVYKYRKSQNNPLIEKLYNKEHGFLHEGPCGHMSHRLLHTHYIDRSASIRALQDRGFKLKYKV